MGRNIMKGKWIEVKSQEEFELALSASKARVQKSKKNYNDPGWYYVLGYSQPCPQGCCYDDVCEIIGVDQVMQEAKREINKRKDEMRDFIGFIWDTKDKLK